MYRTLRKEIEVLAERATTSLSETDTATNHRGPPEVRQVLWRRVCSSAMVRFERLAPKRCSRSAVAMC